MPSTLTTGDGYIQYCFGVPGTPYSEPTEEKMAHELLHKDYDARNLKEYTEKIIKQYKKRNKKFATWVHLFIEGIINMNMDGYVTHLYGSKYEKDIESYCKKWVSDTNNTKQEILSNNYARIRTLFRACEFDARTPSMRFEVITIAEQLTKNQAELSKTLLVAELYRRSFEKGKKGVKLEKKDLEKFVKMTATY